MLKCDYAAVSKYLIHVKTIKNYGDPIITVLRNVFTQNLSIIQFKTKKKNLPKVEPMMNKLISRYSIGFIVSLVISGK